MNAWTDHRKQLQQALGVEKTATPSVVYDNGMRHAVVHVRSESELEAMQPDMNALAMLAVDTIDVFSWEGGAAKLRVFAPAHGVPEDPATGSAAAPLLCHLVENAGFDPHQTLTIHQGAQMRRPSRVHVRRSRASTGDSLMIDVGGAGVEVAEGVFKLPNGSTPGRT